MLRAIDRPSSAQAQHYHPTAFSRPPSLHCELWYQLLMRNGESNEKKWQKYEMVKILLLIKYSYLLCYIQNKVRFNQIDFSIFIFSRSMYFTPPLAPRQLQCRRIFTIPFTNVNDYRVIWILSWHTDSSLIEVKLELSWWGEYNSQSSIKHIIGEFNLQFNSNHDDNIAFHWKLYIKMNEIVQ